MGFPVLPPKSLGRAHRRKSFISNSSNLQNEKHMEMGSLKDTFGHSGYTVFASDVISIIASLLCGV